MSLNVQWPAFSTSTSQFGFGTFVKFSRMNPLPRYEMELSSIASTHESGRFTRAALPELRNGLSTGAAKSSPALTRASSSTTLPAVTAPKLWPITAMRVASMGAGAFVASIASMTEDTSPARVSRNAFVSGAVASKRVLSR